MDDLILQIANISKAQTKQTAKLVAQIEELQAQLNKSNEPFEQAKEELMIKLRPMAIAHGKTYKSEYGTVKFRKGYVRYSWNSKSLNGYAAAHPEILDFRKETTIVPSINVVV